jgi:hypothetical protein
MIQDPVKRALAVSLFVLLAACAGNPVEETSTTTTEPPSTSTTTTVGSTTSTAEVRTCPPAPYRLGFVPVTVGSDAIDPAEVQPDAWTSVGGSRTTFYGRRDGTVAIAVIRGTLPAVDWPGEKGVVDVDGVEAAVGPHPDGTWVMGWYVEPAERCDLYTMVFYPPWAPTEVEQVIEEMERIPG